jgi:hypothetical protein
MQSPPLPRLPRLLNGALWLHSAVDVQEIEPIIQAHQDGFGDDDDPVALRNNLCARPGSVPGDVLYVQDREAGAEPSAQVASSVSLIRQMWTYEGEPLRVGEVGIVSTRPAYRKRGLVREQFAEYDRLALKAGCVLSVISGIPYFYRQFGYEYILPMDGGVSLRPDQIPDLPAGESSSVTLRPATDADMPLLLRFYQKAMQPMCLATLLTPEIWRYQDGLPEGCSDKRKTLMVERHGEPTGYVRMMANENDDWYKGVVLQEAYLPDHADCLAVLRYAKKLALEERKVPTVRVRLPVSVPLAQAALDLGGEPQHSYAWQIKVLDPVGFLLAIRPALERRLAASPWAGMTRDLFLGWYRQSVVLRFREGHLQQVATLSKVDRHDLRCPPNAIAMVWLGYRSVEEVLDWYPDAGCRDKSTLRLMSVLFPKRDSWIVSLF